MTEKRNHYLDIVKGIAIFLMVLGHCIQNGNGADFFNSQAFWRDPITIFIYSFHMPLFMLVSGYLLHYTISKRSFIQSLSNKVKHLLKPIILFNIYNYIIVNTSYIDNSFYSVINLKDLTFKIFDGYWFLWAVLLFSVLVIFIRKFLKDNIIIYVSIFIFLFFVPNFVFNIQTYRIDFMYPFFIMGYFFPKQFKLTRLFLIWLFITAIFVLLLYFYNEKDYIYTSGLNIFHSKLGLPILEQIRIDLFRISIGVTGSISILIFIYHLYKNTINLPFLWRVFAYMGRNSLIIYCLQEILIIFIIKPYTKDFTVSYFNNLLQTFLVLSCCFLIIEILKRNELLRKLHLG